MKKREHEGIDLNFYILNMMTRSELIKKLGRYILLLLIALIAISLGKKVAGENKCTTCTGNGICAGNTDCNIYKAR